MNKVQKDYRFIYSPIPIKRRVRALYEGQVDIMMWDNPAWGWSNTKIIESSLPLASAADKYLALNTPANNQSIFEHLNNFRIAAVHGFHYTFTNFETDIEKLQKLFNLTLVRTEEESILMTLKGKTDISVASTIAINWFLLRNPQYRDKILVSNKSDSEYKRYFLTLATSPITTSELNNILKLAHNKNLLSPIYEKYGIEQPNFNLVQ